MTIDLKLLNTALKKAATVVDSKPIIPALGNVLLSFSKENLIVRSSKGVVSLESVYEGSFEDMEFLVPVNVVSYLSSLPDQPITIEKGEKEVRIRHSKGKYSFPVEDERDFILFPSEGEELAVFDALELKDGVLVCLPFADQKQDSGRPWFNTVCITGSSICAADGGPKSIMHKIPYEGKVKPLTVDLDGAKSFSLIPDSGEVSIIECDRHICFSWDSNKLFIIKRTKEFPLDSFMAIMHAGYTKQVEVDHIEMRDCVKRIALTDSPLLEMAGKVRIYTDKGYLVMTNNEAFESIKVDGDIQDTILNVGDLITALGKMAGTVEIGPIGKMGTMIKNDTTQIVLTNIYAANKQLQQKKAAA